MNMITGNIKYEFGLILVLLSAIVTECSDGSARPTRVAIIGGGIGGTVTAYELSKLASKNGYDINLDLYEPNEIGGRLATTEINGHAFETGGSVIHVENKRMANYVESNGLHWYKDPPGRVTADVVAMYDGEKFIYIKNDFDLFNIIILWWRYGSQIFNFLPNIVEPLLTHFKRIYEAQEENKEFYNVHNLLQFMREDFPDLMKVEVADYLRSQGYSDLFINEIVYTAISINYNQNTKIHAFVGSVALAGMGGDFLRSIEGGNKRVPEVLLARSDARLVKGRVESITLRPDSTYALAVDNASHIYEYVVIACPIIENSESHIKFEGFSDLNIPSIKYQKTVATLVHGELNFTYFHFNSPEGLPNHIGIINEKLFFNSVSVLDPVTPDSEYDRKVFKVFSKEILSDEQLDLLFLTRDSVTVIPWLAYPLYDTRGRNSSFVLHDKLFYVNAIEWAASAMEMSAISGYNVALHINKKLENNN